MHAKASFILLLGCVGCAGVPTYPAWIPGTYVFAVTHPMAGAVQGAVEVTEEGPVSATAENAACIPVAPLRPQTRGRAFRCGGDYQLSVQQGRRGQDPIVGSFGNVRSETRLSQVRTTCAQYSTSTGTSVCVLWNYDTVEESVTTGVSRDFRLVRGSEDDVAFRFGRDE
jgi:hypothetical protein